MNPFIDIYEEKRKLGFSESESYAMASGKLAFHSDRDFDLLQDLYFHYFGDLSDGFDQRMEELKIELFT